MGCNPQTALEWVKAGIAMIPLEAAEDVHAMELNRIDTMQQALISDFVESKDPGLIEGILRLMDRRAKYLGLCCDAGMPANSVL